MITTTTMCRCGHVASVHKHIPARLIDGYATTRDDIMPMLERRAKERQLSTLKRGDKTPDVEIIPQREQRKSRDEAASIMHVNPRYIQDMKKLQENAQEEDDDE